MYYFYINLAKRNAGKDHKSLSCQPYLCYGIKNVLLNQALKKRNTKVIRLPLFFLYSNESELGAGIDPDKALTPFPSRILDEARYEPTTFQS